MKKYYLIIPILILGLVFASCKKNDVSSSPSKITTITAPTVSDIDGNVYDTIKIGTQVWLQENLQTTHYRDGSAIPVVADNTEWSKLTTGAYCYYNNDSANRAIYGKLYNWYAAISPSGIAPVGWHIPSDSEWNVLINYLGGEYAAGGTMKSMSLWNTPNLGASNNSGFTAVPAGARYSVDGTFYDLGNYGGFWSTENSSYGRTRLLSNESAGVYLDSYTDQACGLSIRCIKD